MDEPTITALNELAAVVPLFEEAADIEGFRCVCDLARTKDYAHAAALLSARKFLESLGNGVATFVCADDRATPDMHIRTPGGPFHVEVYAPAVLRHPLNGTMSLDSAERLMEKVLKDKKPQLANRDCVLLVGGFGCADESMDVLREAAASALAKHRRLTLVGIAVHVLSSLVEYRETRAGYVPVGLARGSKSRYAPDMRYEGAIRLRQVECLPRTSLLLRLAPKSGLPHGYVADRAV